MSNRGGKRENAGRPLGQGKYGEPTVTMRIPQSQGATIKNFLDAYQRKRTGSDNEATNVDEFFIPSISDQPTLLPLFSTKVAAGFPSPAADYEDKRLDINEYLVRNPVSTFFFSVQGDSMEGAEIFDGDILVVDKSVRPKHGHIVVAFVDGQRLVKRLYRRAGRVALVAESPNYPTLDIGEEQELVIWGVVVGKFKRFGA